MNIKHPDGYWVQQLTDEDTRDLLDILVSKKKQKKFKKTTKYLRTETDITITYESIKQHCYLTYAEDTLVITDYKISGGHSYMDFYEFMIEKFGEDYATDFIAYANEFIANNPENNWSKRLVNVKKAIPAILDSHTHNIHND